MRTFALLAELQVETNPDAPGVVATATGAGIGIGLLLVFNFAIRHVLTAVHEGGHVLGFVLLGPGVERVVVERKTNARGERVSEGLTTGRGGKMAFLDVVVTGMLGYLGPPLAGLLAADLLGHGHPTAVLWITAIGFALLLLMTKNWFGRFTVFTTALVFFVLARRAEPFYATIAACAWAWILITGGLQVMLDHWWRASDFGILQKKTWIPELFWAAAYVVLIVVIAIEAGLILVGAKEPFL